MVNRRTKETIPYEIARKPLKERENAFRESERTLSGNAKNADSRRFFREALLTGFELGVIFFGLREIGILDGLMDVRKFESNFVLRELQF